jgi:hypothetical protein
MDPIKGIIQFNKDRNLTKFDPVAEYAMLEEELLEFYAAYSAQDTYEMVDALCDLIVIATGGIHKLGYDPTEALSETVKEITSRQGSLNPDTGKWEKDRNQDPKTLYKAHYCPLR